MSTKNSTQTATARLEQEIKDGKSTLLLIDLLIGICILVSVVWMFKTESVFVPLILAILWAPYLAVQRHRVQTVLDKRTEVITFALCERDIFVASKDPNDREVLARARYAIRMLQESGNRYRIKVYYAIYGDAAWFGVWSENGREKTTQYPQQPTTLGEPFPVFLQRFVEFKQARDFERVQWVRSRDNDWANANLFFQTEDIPFEEIK